MSDVLVIAGYAADGLPVLTVDTTSGVFLDDGFSFGQMVLSGSLLDRYAPRSITLPLVVKSSTRANVRAQVEALTLALSRQFFTLTWTPDGGLPLIFDCYDAQLGSAWDLTLDKQAVRRVNVTFTAKPFGRSPDEVTVAGIEASGPNWYATGPVDMAGNSNTVGSAPGLITEIEVAATSMAAATVHASPPGKTANIPVRLSSFSDTVENKDYRNGSVALYDQDGTFGLFTSFSIASSFGGASPVYPFITLTTEIVEYAAGIQTGAYSTVQTIQLNADIVRSDYIPLGFISLPLGGSMGGARSYTARVVSSTGADGNGKPTAKPIDLLILNTDGSTMQMGCDVNTNRVYIVGPEYDADANQVYYSLGTSPADYRIKTRNPEGVVRASGQVFMVHPQISALLVHTPGATPTMTIKYQPRWLSERTS